MSVATSQQSSGPMSGRKEKRTVTKQVLTAKDISEICGISESKSYQIIRQLNSELDKKGILRSLAGLALYISMSVCME